MFTNVFNSILKQNKASQQNRKGEREKKNLWLDKLLMAEVIHNSYFYFMFLF